MINTKRDQVRKNFFNYKLITLLLILSLTIVVQPAQGQISIEKYDVSYEFFTGAQDASPTVCSCSTYIDKIIISNTGNFGAIFTIESNLPNYITIPFNTITLEAGDSKTVDVLISAECGIVSEEEYTLTVKSNLNKVKTITRPLKIVQCQSIDAKLFVEKEEILPCEPINYTLQIKNPSTFDEKYLVSATQSRYAFENPDYELFLPAGTTGLVNMQAGFDCSIYGLQQVGFEVTSLKNDLSANLYHSLNIKQDYKFSVGIQEELDVCEEESYFIPIKVNNEIRFKNAYSAQLINNPEFVKLMNTHTYIDGEDSENFVLEINPEQKKAGIYEFTVKIQSELGTEVFEKNVSLQVNDCYQVSVNFIDIQNPVVCEGTTKLTATVLNNGAFEENISLTSQTKEFGDLSKETITLKPGEKTDVNVNLYVPGELNGQDIKVSLTASLENRSTQKIFSDTLSLKAYAPYFCTLAKLEKYTAYVSYKEDTGYLGITNEGAIETTYFVSLDNTTKLSIEPKTITVAPGDTGYVAVKLNFNGTEPRSTKYKIFVESEENAVVYEYEFIVRKTGSPELDSMLGYLGTSTCKTISGILAAILVLSIILFIVRILTPRRTYKGQGTFNWVLVVIVVLILVFTVIIFGEPQPYQTPLNTSSGNLAISWYENTQKTIDFNDYFKDPDNDTLDFEMDEDIQNISYEINGSIVTFTPDKDFTGNRRIRFIATDSDNSSVTSPRITLDVVELKPETFNLIHTQYCVYINAALLILILLVLVITPFHKKPKEEEGKILKTRISKEKGYRYYVDTDGDIVKKKVLEPKKKSNKK